MFEWSQLLIKTYKTSELILKWLKIGYCENILLFFFLCQYISIFHGVFFIFIILKMSCFTLKSGKSVYLYSYLQFENFNWISLVFSVQFLFLHLKKTVQILLNLVWTNALLLWQKQKNSLFWSECKLKDEEGSLGFCKANPGLVSVSLSSDLKVANPFTLVSGKCKLLDSALCMCWCCSQVKKNIANSEQDMK